MSQNTKTKGQQSVRQNVSTACTACRVSKLKCDGNQPTCGRCESKRKKCIYQAQDDKRRLNAHFMVPFKRALDIFVRRVRQLEPLFQQHGLDLPPVHDEDRAIYEKMIHGYEANSIPPSGTVQGSTGRDQDIIVGVDGTYPLHQPESLSLAVEMPLELDDIPTETTSVFPANSRTQAFPATETTMAAPETEQEARATDFGLDWIDWVDCQLGIDPTSSSSLADITSLDVSHSSTSITTGAAYDNNTLGNNEASEDEKELVFQLSDRMGHLHLMENGQSRFFGATSNFGLTKWKTTSDFGSFPSAQSPGSSVRCATSENADSALESLLEALYFSWADPAFHVVDREMYSHGKSLWQKGQESSPFYSPLLQHAICAYGCLLHDPRRKFESLAREYIGKLKELLEIELDCPKVATVQALVILSTFEAASAREARGWLYSGMAMRVSFDLGLHIDLGPYISNGEMSNAEANARSIAFWGCYIVDHLWGFYLGRPFQTNTGNITIQKPFMDNSHATPQWNPVGLERPSSTRDTLTNTSDQVDLIARQWVFLCESMDALGNIMYGSKSASAEDLLSVANRTVVELREWKSALSMELQIDAEDMSQCPLPHLILLHMQYYQILIYVHRPFLYKDRTSPSLPQICELRDPRAVCLDSAVMIAKLVRMYERLYTLRRINIQAVSIIFSAGLLLVFESLSITHTHDLVDIISYLETCSQALAEVGEYYENASRSLDLLLKIKRDWKARIISHSSFVPKRHRNTQSAIGEPSNKYLRLHNQGNAGCKQHSGEQLARQGMDLYNGMVYAYGIYEDS